MKILSPSIYHNYLADLDVLKPDLIRPDQICCITHKPRILPFDRRPPFEASMYVIKRSDCNSPGLSLAFRQYQQNVQENKNESGVRKQGIAIVVSSLS